MSYFAPYIDESGIHMPTYEDRLEDLVSAYRNIFGIEAELSPAVPDYQLLSVFAKALDDASALVVQAFNSRNPQYASGAALDLLLPQYGLTREAGETDASVRNRIRTALSARGGGSRDAILAAVLAANKVKDALRGHPGRLRGSHRPGDLGQKSAGHRGVGQHLRHGDGRSG